mmetsp:Transcript_11450/g.34508  ORF Transcript_11450/g.34508 Transcript_11450/m.34508 type:complete len:81 (+) Transcript_11450:50-292(+)
MAITTVAYFTAGGLFTALYSNAVRQFPLMRKPQLHLVCSALGGLVGYQAHLYEDRARQELVHMEDQRVAKSAEYMRKLEA